MTIKIDADIVSNFAGIVSLTRYTNGRAVTLHSISRKLYREINSMYFELIAQTPEHVTYKHSNNTSVYYIVTFDRYTITSHVL